MALDKYKAVILTGGAGLRLREVIKDIPKPMAPVAGRPFLEYLILRLAKAGIKEIILCTGYKAEVVESYFGRGRPWGVDIVYSREETPLGTAGALKQAVPLIGSDVFLAMNGDAFLDLNLDEFVLYHNHKQAAATLALVAVADRSRYGAVRTDGRGQVLEFVEKPDNQEGFINGGMYVLQRNIFDNVGRGAVSLEHTVFPSLVNKGLYAMKTEGFFVDIGLPEDYSRICADARCLT